jgi:hypothetical protein
MVSLISPDIYQQWKEKLIRESKKLESMISGGKEAINKIPHVLPEEKE